MKISKEKEIKMKAGTESGKYSRHSAKNTRIFIQWKDTNGGDEICGGITVELFTRGSGVKIGSHQFTIS